MLKVGLTGGMGSGKSTLLEFYRKENWLALDADRIVRDILVKDAEVLGAIRKRFGEGVVGTDGRISRPALAAVVFGDDQALEWLENLLHPRVRRVWVSALQSTAAPAGIVEVPLLFEKNLENYFDFTVSIYTSLELRLKRLSDSGIPPDSAKPRMARQMPSDQKARRADFVLLNDGSISFLQEQASRLRDLLSPKFQTT